jgi:hypothetical protein
MEKRLSAEPAPRDLENTLEQRKKETTRKRKTLSDKQHLAEKAMETRPPGRRKKHPISLRPTNEIYELSETMANQRGKDRSVQDHNAYTTGLIVEAVSGPEVHGKFGTLSASELDEWAIPLYIALGGYLKRRGKLPPVFGEGPREDSRQKGRLEYWNGHSDSANQSQNILLALDEEAEAALGGGPGPS